MKTKLILALLSLVGVQCFGATDFLDLYGTRTVLNGAFNGNGTGLTGVTAVSVSAVSAGISNQWRVDATNATVAKALIATNTVFSLSYDSSSGGWTNGAGTQIVGANGLVLGGGVGGAVALSASALSADASGITGTLLGSSVGANSAVAGPMLTTNANKIVPTWNAGGLTNVNASQLTGLIPKAQAGSMTNVTDITITGAAPTAGDVLMWGGTAWTNRPSIGLQILLLGTGNNTAAANTTYFFGTDTARLLNTSYTIAAVDIPCAGRITRVQYKFDIGSTLGSGEVANFWIELNNATDILNFATPINVAVSNKVVTGSQAVVPGDTIALKFTTPSTWATPAAQGRYSARVTIEP